MARFLLDEHIGPRVAERLRRRGIDATAVSGSALEGIDDETLIRHAIADKRIVVTYNIGDFAALVSKLIREGLDIPGVVFVDDRTISASDLTGLVEAIGKLAGKIDRNECDAGGGIFLS